MSDAAVDVIVQELKRVVAMQHRWGRPALREATDRAAAQLVEEGASILEVERALGRRLLSVRPRRLVGSGR